MIQDVHCEAMLLDVTTKSTTIVVTYDRQPTNYRKILSYEYIPHASNPSNLRSNQ